MAVNTKLKQYGETAIQKLLSDDPLATVSVEVEEKPIKNIIYTAGAVILVVALIIVFVAKRK